MPERFLCITPDGALVVAEGSKKPWGCCPFCREMNFREIPGGWLECTGSECGFRVLKSDAERVGKQESANA